MLRICCQRSQFLLYQQQGFETKLVQAKETLYTEACDRIVNNDATTIISNKFLPVTAQLNTSKSINSASFLNPGTAPCTDSSCFPLYILRQLLILLTLVLEGVSATSWWKPGIFHDKTLLLEG